jgi:hypothetical protein
MIALFTEKFFLSLSVTLGDGCSELLRDVTSFFPELNKLMLFFIFSKVTYG